MNKTILKNDLFENMVLDEYEQRIEDSIDVDNYQISGISKKERLFWQEIAKRHIELRKSKRINIRINNMDLAGIKAKAKLNNMPYQTLLSTLIHKFAKGEIKITL
jgi:predicted DNA binding CopG/RHH family protein